MLIAQLIHPGQIIIAEGAVPEPAPGEVLVKVKAVGICGSDVLSFVAGGIGGLECKYPQVLGHEPTGTVVKTGAGVTGFEAGDRVVLEPAIYCFHCEFCQTGHHNICRNIHFQSADGVPGFLREYVSVPATNLLPLPNELGFIEGTLFEPLAVALHSMKFVSLQPLDNVVVFGAGPIGLLTIALLRVCGARRIWAVEPFPYRRELARNMGADAPINPNEVDAAREIALETALGGADIAIDCAGRGDSLRQCAEAVRNGGRMIVTGIPHHLEEPFNWHVARRKELVIYNVRRSNHESEAALQFLRERGDLLRPLVTHVVPLAGVQGAFEMLRDLSANAGKAVVSLETCRG